jgi:hypothetical protein
MKQTKWTCNDLQLGVIEERMAVGVLRPRVRLNLSYQHDLVEMIWHSRRGRSPLTFEASRNRFCPAVGFWPLGP